MNRVILSLFVFLIQPVSTFAQNLSFDEVLNLRKKSLSDVEEYLNSKGWDFLKASKQDEEFSKYGYVTFSYKKLDHIDYAQSFIYYFFSEYYKNKILIQIFKKDIYNKYMTRINSIGMRLIKTDVENGSVVKVYQGKTTTVKLTIYSKKEEQSDSSKTGYHFFILDNWDYNTHLN